MSHLNADSSSSREGASARGSASSTLAAASAPLASTPSSPPASPPSVTADPLGFVWDLKGNPCFRSSLMWGIGVGAAMGVHSFTRHRLPYKASDAAVKTFAAVSALSWLWCRHQASKEKELFDAVFEKQHAARHASHAATADHPPPHSSPQLNETAS